MLCSEQKNLAGPQGCLREGSSTLESSSVVSWCIQMVRGERIRACSVGSRHQKGSPPSPLEPPSGSQKSRFSLGQTGDSPKCGRSLCLFILCRIIYLLVRPVSNSVSESWITVWGKSIFPGVRRESPSIRWLCGLSRHGTSLGLFSHPRLLVGREGTPESSPVMKTQAKAIKTVFLIPGVIQISHYH